MGSLISRRQMFELESEMAWIRFGELVVLMRRYSVLDLSLSFIKNFGICLGFSKLAGNRDGG